MDTLQIVVTLMVAPIASVVTWILSRRKNGAQVESLMTDAANSITSSALAILEETQARKNALQEENATLKKEIEHLTALVKELETEVSSLNRLVKKFNK